MSLRRSPAPPPPSSSRFLPSPPEPTVRPRLRVMTSKHEPFYPRVQQRAHTHQTRLDRNVQRGADQTVVPNMPGGLTQGLDLGVGSWVVERDRGVMTATNEHLVADHYCPHRDLARGFGASRFLQSRGHPERVICHRGRSASYRRC